MGGPSALILALALVLVGGACWAATAAGPRRRIAAWTLALAFSGFGCVAASHFLRA